MAISNDTLVLAYAPSGEPFDARAFLLSGSSPLSQFAVAEEIATGQLLPLLEELRPRNIEAIGAVFAGGDNTPGRVRVSVDFLAERLGNPLLNHTMNERQVPGSRFVPPNDGCYRRQAPLLHRRAVKGRSNA